MLKNIINTITAIRLVQGISVSPCQYLIGRGQERIVSIVLIT